MVDVSQDKAAKADEAGTAVRGPGGGAAAGVTGDNADAGEWPDDIASDRGSSADHDDHTVPQSEEDAAAKLGDFA